MKRNKIVIRFQIYTLSGRSFEVDDFIESKRGVELKDEGRFIFIPWSNIDIIRTRKYKEVAE